MHTNTERKQLDSVPFLYDSQNQNKLHMHHQNASAWSSITN